MMSIIGPVQRRSIDTLRAQLCRIVREYYQSGKSMDAEKFQILEGFFFGMQTWVHSGFFRTKTVYAVSAGLDFLYRPAMRPEDETLLAFEVNIKALCRASHEQAFRGKSKLASKIEAELYPLLLQQKDLVLQELQDETERLHAENMRQRDAIETLRQEFRQYQMRSEAQMLSLSQEMDEVRDNHRLMQESTARLADAVSNISHLNIRSVSAGHSRPTHRSLMAPSAPPSPALAFSRMRGAGASHTSAEDAGGAVKKDPAYSSSF